ncbi:phenylalanine--tRNA ligase subunit beta [Granulicoccus phenolivorans]|uniref:phenylalanine--tRNA ligase subunit beta n=1 Tax=Granulicoccus phenolivorans TaxID=266854 RepID=UPI00040E7CF4|nr:phenylalanine--tRNA ligase subunit beta [Granulicoccus phenolivorans]
MRAPVSWLREYAAIPESATAREIGEKLIAAGLEVETVEEAGADVTGPVVVGRVLTAEKEPQKNGKTINWCSVEVGEAEPRGIVCGAHNFEPGDWVVVALPGALLPGDFAIAARKTYGHVSDGMICSTSELGLGDDGSEGIIVLGSGDAATDDAGNPLVAGADATALLHLRDDVLDIAVTPDLGYCLSIRGLAREAAQAYDVAFTDPVTVDVPAERHDGFGVTLTDPACPVFVAVTVTGIDPQARSPRWLQRRVQLGGMRPISLGVDLTNYVMLETGQPLHAYDAATLTGGITVRRARAGETLVTLDDQTRTLDPEDLLITDESGPIGLAGVMGGQNTELRADTTTVVIEAATFDQVSIARTSRRHKLSSEASRRFERGVDPNATYAAAHRVATLLTELAGGTVESAETVAGGVPAQPQQTIDADLPARILGADIPVATTIEKLTASGVQVEQVGERLVLTPPTWRPDLRDPYDYVEEVACKVGMDVVEPVVPRAPVGRGLTKAQRGRRAVSAALVDAGFVEVLTFPFVGPSDLDALGIPADDTRRTMVRLANPLSDLQPNLRTTLLPGLTAAAVRNTSRSNDDLALFELGKVFWPRPEHTAAPVLGVDRRPTDTELAALDAALPAQPNLIGCLLAGNWQPAGWAGPAAPAGWQQALAFAEIAAHAVGLTVRREAAERAPWHPGRCAAILVGDEVLGYAGELHPTVIHQLGLPARAAAAELNLDRLIELAPDRGALPPLASFPVAKEDVALIVDAGVPQAAVEAALRTGAGELLESIRLFDVYAGDQIAAGKKSLAYALRFRADRTLTDADAAAARDAAVAAAAEQFGAVLRS